MRPFAKISEMRADYVMKGQILIFPVNAHGKCVVTLRTYTNIRKLFKIDTVMIRFL